MKGESWLLLSVLSQYCRCRINGIYLRPPRVCTAVGLCILRQWNPYSSRWWSDRLCWRRYWLVGVNGVGAVITFLCARFIPSCTINFQPLPRARSVGLLLFVIFCWEISVHRVIRNSHSQSLTSLLCFLLYPYVVCAGEWLAECQIHLWVLCKGHWWEWSISWKIQVSSKQKHFNSSNSVGYLTDSLSENILNCLTDRLSSGCYLCLLWISLGKTYC